ncbi:hypothetical protein JCM8202v2_006177 [Rhodotorula sphaerocarpa]
MSAALDAPTASLPLINSLTHLSYLTATSPRVREILAGDGGLERLVTILQQCAQGGAGAAETAATVPGSASPASSNKGKAVQRRRPRKSPFKPFAEYSALPTLADIRVFEELGIPFGISPSSETPSTSFGDELPPFALPPSLVLPQPDKQRSLLHTYTLAFQCIVNIGVRGSEAIRTRVVEAGALEVVVYALERYLEDVERRRAQACMEWQRQREASAAASHQALVAEDAAMEVEEASLETATTLRESLATTFAETPVAGTPQIALPPATASLPLLTRVNVVAASSSSGFEPGLQPPSRVQTPDTVLSMDDSSVTGDENGSASGADADGEEGSMPSSSASSTTPAAAPVARCPLNGQKTSMNVEAAEDVDMHDDSSRAPSRAPSPAPADRARPDASEQADAAARPTRRLSRPQLPRMRTQPEPLPSYSGSLDGEARPTEPPVSRHAAPARTEPREASSPGATAKGPLRFRDEDVLLSLQLLAYLSKYPHVRAIFHSSAVNSLPTPPSHSTWSSSVAGRAMNIFSLVEAFTFKPASDDLFTPRHSTEVQYWAGVIMRNACRKDDARGGIRQCANMRCVKWEQYAREFAKCRRCRRAKYCSKVCQSEAWTQGHRYWCHKVASRRGESNDVVARSSAVADSTGGSGTSSPAGVSSGTEGLATPRGDEAVPSRRRHPHHHHHHHHHAHGHSHAAPARRRHRSAEEDEDDDEELPPPPVVPLPDAGATPRAHPQRLPAGAPEFDLGPAEIGPTQTGLVPGVDEDHIAREMLRASSGAGIGIGLGDNFDGVVRVPAT